MAFLRNVWYCAGFGKDLGPQPLARRYLNEEVVLYRGASGRAYAMSARCPHRFAPLDRGKVIDETLMCGYHGLRFANDGKCVMNPHGTHIPPLARLKTYPLAEKSGVLWIWMGDAGKADEAALPHTNFLSNPAYATFTFYMKVNAHYELVTDNLLDLTHAPYIHAGTLSNGPADAVMDHHFSTDGNVIHSNYHTPAEPRSVWFEKIFDEPRGESFANMTWRPASTLELDLSLHPVNAGGKGGVHTPSLHYLTPETQTTTHYFNAQGRNRKIEDPAATAHAMELIRRGFLEEDAPMITACQEFIGTADLLSLRPQILETDAPAVRARQILAKMIRQEQGDVS